MDMKNVILGVAGAVSGAALVGTGYFLCKKYNFNPFKLQNSDEDFELSKLTWKEPKEITELDVEITRRARFYKNDAAQLLRDLIQLQAESSDNQNFENKCLNFLKNFVIEKNCVLSPADVEIDSFGNLIWSVCDKNDPTPLDDRGIIFLNGNSGNINCNPGKWKELFGEGIDAFLGVTDPSQVNEEEMKNVLGYVPPKNDWNGLIFGNGILEQLQGFVLQVFASKILLETSHLKSLTGCKVFSLVTFTSLTSNNNSIVKYLQSNAMKNALNKVPDCVILTNPTGHIKEGPCGIYIGHRGYCQIEIEVIGNNSSGFDSMNCPNPLEYGSLIIAEAAEQAKFEGFLQGAINNDNNRSHGNVKFLGPGSRTATNCYIDSHEEYKIPSKFVCTLDRKMIKGETPEKIIQELENELNSVKKARQAGCQVNISIKKVSNNPLFYPTWVTDPSDPAVKSAVESYQRTVSIPTGDNPTSPDNIPKKPRIDHWTYSVSGVNFVIKKNDISFSIDQKHWIKQGELVHPPMIGIGAGYEYQVHKPGEYVNPNDLWAPLAVISRFPSLYSEKRKH